MSAQRSRARSVVGCALGLAAAIATAQSGGGFEIARYSIDAGAGRSSAAPFELVAVVGQPDAATAQGGGFEWRGGVLVGVAPSDVVFGNGFEASGASR
jgi:hypothetical protein